MKRNFKLLMILLLTLLLAGCGDLFGSKRKEVELSESELHSLVKDLDFGLYKEQGISLDMGVDVEVMTQDIQKVDGRVTSNNSVIAKLEGNLNVYANFNSKKDLYVAINGELDVEVRVVSSGVGQNLDHTFVGRVSLDLYLVNGTLYVDSDLSALGITLSSKQKVTNLINDNLYGMLFGNIEEVLEMINSDFDITEIFDEFRHKDIKVYQMKNTFEVVFPLEKYLADSVESNDYEYEGAYFSDLRETIKNDFKGTTAYVVFNEKSVLNFGAKIKTDLEILSKNTRNDSWGSYDNENRIKVKGGIEVDVNLNAKAPKKVDEAKLTGHFEQDSVKVLINMLFDSQIYANVPINLPKLDSNFISSSLIIDNNGTEVTGLEKDNKINALIDALDVQELVNEPIRVQAEVDMYFAREEYVEYTYSGWNEETVEFRITGSLDAFIDQTTYNNFYGYIDLDLNVKVNYDMYDYYGSQFKFTLDVDVEGSIYFIGSDIYLTLIISTLGQTMKVEVKLADIFTVDIFNQLKDVLQEIPALELELSDLPMDLIRLYKDGNKDYLEVLLNTAIKEMVDDMDDGEEIIPAYYHVNVITNDIKNSSASLVFNNNKLEQAGLALDFNVKYKETYKFYYGDGERVTTMTFKGRLNAVADFNANDPGRRLTASDFSDHYEITGDFFTTIFRM